MTTEEIEDEYLPIQSAPTIKYCMECYHRKSKHVKSKKTKRYHCKRCDCQVKKSAFD